MFHFGRFFVLFSDFYSQGVSVYISTASLTTIALERLRAVRETNLLRETDRRNAVLKIALINALSVLAILPYCLHMEVTLFVVMNNDLVNCILSGRWTATELRSALRSGQVPGGKYLECSRLFSNFSCPP